MGSAASLIGRLRLSTRVDPEIIGGAVAWLVLVLPALHGFPDAVWLGFGALMIRELTRRRPVRVPNDQHRQQGA